MWVSFWGAKVAADSPFQLFVVRSMAKDEPHSSQLKLTLNSDPRYDHMMKVVTLDGRPKLQLNPELYIEPTLVGGETKREFYVGNPSNLEVNFKWFCNTPNLQIEPPEGTIRPLDGLTFTLYFLPTSPKQYLLKPELQYWTHPSQAHGSKIPVIWWKTLNNCVCRHGHSPSNLGVRRTSIRPLLRKIEKKRARNTYKSTHLPNCVTL